MIIESREEFMSINEIIIYIMVLFMLVGAIDKCIGGKLGLSEQFEEEMCIRDRLKKEEHTQNSEFKSLEKNCVQPDKEETTIEDGIIPDITEVDIQEQFLVPNAINEEAYRKIKKFTPARLGLWRAGNLSLIHI